MSEELQQRYPKGKGYAFGRFEAFELQLTTLGQLAANGIIPQVNYGEYSSQKPDSIVISRSPSLEVVAVGERKAPGGLSGEKWRKYAEDLLETKARPLNARIAFVSDGTETYWLNGLATEIALLRHEDGAPLPAAEWGSHDTQKFIELAHTHMDGLTGIIRKDVPLDPRLLAENVWQIVWRVSGSEPQECLATFVEIFIYKFLNDLKLTGRTKAGENTDLAHLLSLPEGAVYPYYHKVVRPYIKRLFPPGADELSIINGTALKESNRDHSILFREILEKFQQFGPLTNVSSDFKRKLYESFLKESQIVQQFGQYFTPRNVVSAMYDLAEVDSLTPGKTILDPACGVGGFLLEGFARDPQVEWNISGAKMVPRQHWQGNDRDWKTTVLAKANALVHCGQILANRPQRVKAFSAWINKTFVCYGKEATGSLSRMYENVADVVLTNPPYVVSGSKGVKQFVKGNKFRRYFESKSSGVEGLFVQAIVHSLKDNGQAVILLPETLLLRSTDAALRRWVLSRCRIDMIALLPEDTFYNTSKRVAILSLRRRPRGGKETVAASERTLLTILSEVGETRDTKRLPTRSDLPELVVQYRRFRGDPSGFASNIRFKSVPTADLLSADVWYLPGWWSEAERVELGVLTPEILPKVRVDQTSKALLGKSKAVKRALVKIRRLSPPPEPVEWMEVSLKDPLFFGSRIGKRVVQKEVYLLTEGIPVYSANVRSPFGFIQKANAGSLPNGGCLWAIDSDYDVREVGPEDRYWITDHTGELEIKDPRLNPVFVARQLRRAGLVKGLGRDYRASLQNMKRLSIRIPAKRTGAGLEPDRATQDAWARFYVALEQQESVAGSG